MSKKYVFLDIDGTLVDFDSTMPESAVTALRSAHNNGHNLIISTGRQQSQIYPWLLEAVNFDALMVSSGARIQYGGRDIYTHFATPAESDYMIDYFRSQNVPFCLQTPGPLVSEEWCVKSIFETFRSMGVTDEKFNLFADSLIVEDARGRSDVEKFVFYNSPRTNAELQSDIGDNYHVISYSFGNLNHSHGEITLSCINKATGIAEFLRYVGADISDSIAIGDGENDIEMVEYAGIGVAMGNSCQELKDIADVITGKVNCDGLLEAFMTLGLI